MQSETEKPKTRIYLDIPHAAKLAGYSVRNFRRIIEEDEIPFFEISRKMFVLYRDLENWQRTKKPYHLKYLES